MKSVWIILFAWIALCSSSLPDEPRLDFTNDFVVGLLSHLARSKLRLDSDYIHKLITENRINIAKDSSIDIHTIVYNNIVADSFINLATSTAHYLENTLDDLLIKPFINVGMQSVDVEKIETTIDQSIARLIQTFRVFAYKAVIIWSDREKLDELVKAMDDDVERMIGNLAEQIIDFVPISLAQEFDEVFGIFSPIFDYWAKSLANSLGPFPL